MCPATAVHERAGAATACNMQAVDECHTQCMQWGTSYQCSPRFLSCIDLRLCDLMLPASMSTTRLLCTPGCLLSCSECIHRSKRSAKGWEGFQVLEVLQGWWGYLEYGLPCVLMVCLEVSNSPVGTAFLLLLAFKGWLARHHANLCTHYRHTWCFTLLQLARQLLQKGSNVVVTVPLHPYRFTAWPQWWMWEVVVLLAGLLPDAEVAVAATGLSIQIQTIPWIMCYSLGTATATRVAQALGAGDAIRAARLFRWVGCKVGGKRLVGHIWYGCCRSWWWFTSAARLACVGLMVQVFWFWVEGPCCMLDCAGEVTALWCLLS